MNAGPRDKPPPGRKRKPRSAGDRAAALKNTHNGNGFSISYLPFVLQVRPPFRRRR
jgi:hypothetical protein